MLSFVYFIIILLLICNR